MSGCHSWCLVIIEFYMCKTSNALQTRHFRAIRVTNSSSKPARGRTPGGARSLSPMAHGLAGRSAPRKHVSSVTDGANVTQEVIGVSLGSAAERPCAPY